MKLLIVLGISVLLPLAVYAGQRNTPEQLLQRATDNNRYQGHFYGQSTHTFYMGQEYAITASTWRQLPLQALRYALFDCLKGTFVYNLHSAAQKLFPRWYGQVKNPQQSTAVPFDTELSLAHMAQQIEQQSKHIAQLKNSARTEQEHARYEKLREENALMLELYSNRFITYWKEKNQNQKDPVTHV